LCSSESSGFKPADNDRAGRFLRIASCIDRKTKEMIVVHVKKQRTGGLAQ
jgi:hypothetical protein